MTLETEKPDDPLERIHTSSWEQGSDFHWISFSPTARASQPPWQQCYQLYGSGRDALYALMDHGRANLNWKRIWVPSYFCQDVVSTILSTGIIAGTYLDGPFHETSVSNCNFKTGDSILLVNFFGTRKSFGLLDGLPEYVSTIEDHSHDPWSDWAHNSTADFCVASLRKTLPLPDGGVLWSPKARRLPHPPRTAHRHQRAVVNKLNAMLLKKLYLEGHQVSKNHFRQHAIRGEREITATPPAAISDISKLALPLFPINEWRRTRRANYQLMTDGLEDCTWVTVLQGEDKSCFPFVALLSFDTRERCSIVRERLISKRVYPASLWSLENRVFDVLPAESVEISRRSIAIHCDMRYNKTDMIRVIDTILESGSMLP